MSTLKGRNLISITDFSKEEYIEVLDIAEGFEKNPKQRILSDKVIATLFFEPSTRTRLSFESAANQLGARIIGFSDPGGTSVQKGESLHDTIVMVSSYADLIVLRSIGWPKAGFTASRYHAENSSQNKRYSTIMASLRRNFEKWSLTVARASLSWLLNHSTA